jgi:hypothetical protein
MSQREANPNAVPYPPVVIPIKGLEADEANSIAIPYEDFPDPSELLDVLRREAAPLPVWLQIIAFYVRDGKLSEALSVMRQCDSAPFRKRYAHDPEGLALMLNACVAASVCGCAGGRGRN